MAKRKIDGTVKKDEFTYITSGKAIHEEELSFKWKIKNFLLIKSSDFLIEKQRFNFTIGESYEYSLKWACELTDQPETNTLGPCFYLEKYPTDFQVVANYSFQVIKANGAVGKTASAENVIFTPEENFKGSSTLIPRNDTSNKELIWEDGSILIKVKIKVFLFKLPSLSNLEEEADTFEMTELYNLSNLMTKMIEPDNPFEGKIIKLVAKDQKEFYVKTDILSARSPVFDAMLNNGNWKESGENGSMVLNDLSGKTVKVLLHYLYGGLLLKEDWRADDVILELTLAAHKYQLERLTQFLDKVLPLINFGSTEILARMTLLTKGLKMKNAEEKLFAKLKETAMDIDPLVLDKGRSLIEID